MEQALALAAVAEGATSPNPRVGCVLVRDRVVVGRGFHAAAGTPHAEALAIAEAGGRARGATLYVNLEPCAHHGRTAPCTEALVAAGVARVVAAHQDPNPLVDGRGFAVLRAAGVAVEVGLLGRAADEINAPFLAVHRRGLPVVTLKAGVSLDGQITAASGRSRWITGPLARRFAHRLRLAHDAILVGAGTVRTDDPQLTVRLPGVSAPRLRAVLSERLDLDPRSAVFRVSPGASRTRIYTSSTAAQASLDALRRVADVIPVARLDAGLDLRHVLRDLLAAGVQSVLVEGGGRTHAGFVAAGLASRIALFLGPTLLGARGATPLLDGPSVPSLDRALRIVNRRVLPLGDDLLVLGRVG
jgi:diaminohydroxyphosphoribosylaminopyrimidine deaminase/5-amino-6-(5-phosphoribosylamino)uracil reductase